MLTIIQFMDKRVTMNEKMLQEALLISPFHRWLGLGIQSRTESELELTMPWREEIISNPSIGAAHGGILASLVDLTGLYVLIATGTSAKATADLRVDYHRPAIGGPLTAVGRAVKAPLSSVQKIEATVPSPSKGSRMEAGVAKVRPAGSKRKTGE